MKTNPLSLLLGTALASLAATPFSLGAGVAASPQGPVAAQAPSATQNTGYLYTLNTQVAASAAAFQRGTDATALQSLATPALPASATAVQGALDLGWRLGLVARRLASVGDYPTARHVGNLALAQLGSATVTAGTPAQQAQALELAGGLSEAIFNDRPEALRDYQSAVALDASRKASAARIGALQGVQVQVATVGVKH